MKVSDGFRSQEMTGHVCSPSWQILVKAGQRWVPVMTQNCRKLCVKNHVFGVKITFLSSKSRVWRQKSCVLRQKSLFRRQNHVFCVKNQCVSSKSRFGRQNHVFSVKNHVFALKITFLASKITCFTSKSRVISAWTQDIFSRWLPFLNEANEWECASKSVVLKQK